MEYKTLDEIALINPSSIKKDYLHKEIEYIDISSVGTGHLIETKKMLLSEASSRAKRLVRDKDTILSTVRPNRRSFLFVKKPKENIVVSTGFAVLRAKNGTDPRYLYYAITDQKFTDYLTLSAKGAAYPAVDTEIVQRGKIPYWPLGVQKKVSAILSSYDDLIENNTRRIQILYEMYQRIFREWFIDFRFPGCEGTKFIDSELGKIPNGWRVLEVQDLCSRIGSGGTPSRTNKNYWDNPEINWFKTKELLDTFLFDSEEKISNIGLNNSAAKLFPAGTVVMALYAAPTVGRLGILTKEASFNQAACGFVANTDLISWHFLFSVLYNLRDYYCSISQGAAQQNINVEKAKTAKCLLPDKSLCDLYSNSVAPILDNVCLIKQKNILLKECRDLLIPRLISGEIDISELDIERLEEVNGA